MPPVPGKGGPPWIELTSDHVTVWTDASSAQARALIHKLERFRRILLATVAGERPVEDHSIVVLLRSDAELGAISFDDEPRAYVDLEHGLLPSVAVLSTSYEEHRGQPVAHQLTHLVAWNALRGQPEWLAEGMAQYFETVDLDFEDTRTDVGWEPSHAAGRIQRAGFAPTAELLAWTSADTPSPQQCNTAWALFSFLVDQHHAELVRYLQLLDEPSEPAAQPGPRSARLWPAAFPSLPLASVDAVLRHWLATGTRRVLHVHVQQRSEPLTERVLSDADVHAVRGRLFATQPEAHAQARDAIASAIAIEPTHVLAWLARLKLEDGAITPGEGRAIAAAHRDDWRAWLLAAHAIERAHGAADEIAAAVGQACRLGGALATRGTSWSCEASHAQTSAPPSAR